MAGIDVHQAIDDPNRDARLGALALRYREPLVRYFLRKRLPKEAAEDCAQEVFLRLARTNEETVQNAEAYLFTIASSVVVSFLRKAKTHRETQHHPIDDFSLVSGEAGPDRVLEADDPRIVPAQSRGWPDLHPDRRPLCAEREGGRAPHRPRAQPYPPEAAQS
jgi:DNA-directed RNA polymerase specialized sigma24 family protein